MSETLQAATERLNRALEVFEARAREARARSAIREDDLFAGPPPSGDEELRAAAVQASEALGRAAETLREAIGEES